MLNFELCIVIVCIGSLSTASGIRMEAAPSHINIGVTRYLNVRCSTTRGDDSSMESLMSLIISRSKTSQDKDFQELASMTTFTPMVQIKDVLEVNMTASGNIDNNEQSYIDLVWEYPDVTKIGVYKCEAHGVDHTGHPAYVNTTVVVSSTHPDCEPVLEQVKTQAAVIEQLTSKVDNLTSTARELNQQLKQLLGKDLTSIYKISPGYNGKIYLFSVKYNTLSAGNSAVVCNTFGGYLVEIDSEQEYNFIIQNLPANEGYSFFYVGATDFGHENVWIYVHTNTSVTYLNWRPGDPDGRNVQNCLTLFTPTWLMADAECSYTRESLNMGYICEVPEH
ncbi:uncharacterized protein LOC131934586 [Physella acuta]|uniref:uncharacterized protein LOC131934586 n=1 Tax=Physella acuta TaxID=109671 RepID=UPI0027DB1BBE|nr:uncharacterized protein LOC131934586 [Physella acuta]